jgi:hypothetical protein
MSGICSCCDGHALDSDELIGPRLFDIETELDGFANPLHEYVKRFGLRVAAAKSRN